MTSPALAIIEEVYETTLNPTLDYLAQLAPLAPSGELADKIKLGKLVFRLCGLVDEQAKEIEKLKTDRTEIASEMVKLHARLTQQDPRPIASETPDPTQPIDVPTPNPAKQDTNGNL